MADNRKPRSLAAWLLRLASLLVPSAERRVWLETWEAELWQLENTRQTSRRPTALGLGVGSLQHSLWERKEWTVGVMLQDIRFALRVLARSPGYTLLAILTMALGIGANTTIFSLANATLLRAPDAIDRPERLVQIGRDRPDEVFDNTAYPYFRELAEHSEGLAGLAAYAPRRVSAGRGADVELLRAQLVTGAYFDLLGVTALTGRTLGRNDDVFDGGHPVAVISEAYWARRFGSDVDVVGTDVHLNGAEYEVVGVAEPGFRGTDVVSAPTDVWVPMRMVATLLGPDYIGYDQPGMSWLWMIGRLAPGATVASLDAEIDALYATSFEANWGEAPDHTLGVVASVGLRPEERASIGRIIVALSLVVAAVLAVACANFANLLLARGIARRPELGIRTALGAGRVRLVRQLMTENVVLAIGGGAGALLLTIWTAQLLPLALPMTLGVSFRPDLTVLGFALATSLLAGVVFGVAPALRASRVDVLEGLKEGAPLSGHRGDWIRSGLVTGQLALSFSLLACAALLLQSLLAARSADPGFSTRNVMTLSMDLGAPATTASAERPSIRRCWNAPRLCRASSLRGWRQTCPLRDGVASLSTFRSLVPTWRRSTYSSTPRRSPTTSCKRCRFHCWQAAGSALPTRRLKCLRSY